MIQLSDTKAAPGLGGLPGLRSKAGGAASVFALTLGDVTADGKPGTSLALPRQSAAATGIFLPRGAAVEGKVETVSAPSGQGLEDALAPDDAADGPADMIVGWMIALPTTPTTTDVLASPVDVATASPEEATIRLPLPVGKETAVADTEAVSPIPPDPVAAVLSTRGEAPLPMVGEIGPALSGAGIAAEAATGSGTMAIGETAKQNAAVAIVEQAVGPGKAAPTVDVVHSPDRDADRPVPPPLSVDAAKTLPRGELPNASGTAPTRTADNIPPPAIVPPAAHVPPLAGRAPDSGKAVAAAPTAPALAVRLKTNGVTTMRSDKVAVAATRTETSVTPPISLSANTAPASAIPTRFVVAERAPDALAAPVATRRIAVEPPTSMAVPVATPALTVADLIPVNGRERAAFSLVAPVVDPASIGMAAPVEPAARLAEPAPIDTSRTDWIEGMIEQIDVMREASADGAGGTTRIRLSPDALGAVEIVLSGEGDTIDVRITAETVSARNLLAEAAPRLTDMAEARGLKLAQGHTDGGQSGERNAPRQNADDRSTANDRRHRADVDRDGREPHERIA